MQRRRINIISFVGIATVVLAGAINPSIFFNQAEALSGSDFDASRIIDDSVFFNPNSMSSQEIQLFLNAKVPTCDTNGALQYGSTGMTRAQWASANGKPTPPYTCLKDYSENTSSKVADAYCGAVGAGNKSAATIIKEVATACSINPQVLLVLLQKEQSLITDDWPWPRQYEAATGYACPDTAPCDSEFAGFFNQVYYGARQYQRYAKQSHLFSYRAGQTSFISYQANNPGCGGTNITIQNQATAGLYNYTPYQPNAAALSNLYGSGDTCSAYGNRNFWRMFWDWFGNPIGSPYAWLIDNFSYSGGDNLLTKGQAETIILKARNVGRLPWYNHGTNPVRLGTWQPPDRGSQLLGGSNRYATLLENVVQPNELGTFSFQVTPQNMGTFVESMNLVAENAQWMSWPGFSPTISVTNGYQWQIDDIIYGNGTGVMEPGTTQLITLKAKNTGNFTWQKGGGSPVRLGTWEPGRSSQVASGWLAPSRVVDMNENSVAPGQTAGFQFYVRMPSGGNFYERLNLVSEGQSWFNDPGLTLYLHGKTYAWQPVWQSLSTGNPNIGRNQTFDITIKVKNTGEMAWKKTDPFKVRLATANPLNRGSGIYSGAWINDTRPAALVEDVVNPGQEGTFTFNSRTPNAPGARYEYFSLVAEGVQWFNNPGLSIYINVL